MAQAGGQGAIQPPKLSWKILLAAGLGAMLLAILVVVVVKATSEPKDIGTAPLDAGKGGSSNGLSVTNVNDPVRPLTTDNLTWESFNGEELPVGASGPHQLRDGRAEGFDRTPQGAVLATMYISGASTAFGGPSVFQPTISEQVVGPDKNAFLATIQREYAESVRQYGADAAGGLSPEREAKKTSYNSQGVWAYRIDTYSRDAATVNVLSMSLPPGSDPIYTNFAMSVRWVQGDWRLVAPVAGVWSSYARNMASIPANYVVIGQQQAAGA